MTDWNRIAKIVGMLGSAGDGEVVNAARLIAREGISFAELANRVRNGGGVGLFGTTDALAQAAAHKVDAMRWRERAAAAEDQLRRAQYDNNAMKLEIRRLQVLLDTFQATAKTHKEIRSEKPSRPRERPYPTYFLDVLNALRFIQEHRFNHLTEWERSFITSLIERLDEDLRPLTNKQIECLARICKRVRVTVDDLQPDD